jgi:transcriptional regulator with XRE-family HTH domain
MALDLLTPPDLLLRIARAEKAKRLSLDLSQQTLAARSGVSLGTLKRFERSGKISLESLLNLALTLGSLDEFSTLFKPASPLSFLTLDRLLSQKTRKRGRK